MHRRRLIRKLHSEQEATPANRNNVWDFLQTVAQILLYRAYIFEHPLVFDRFKSSAHSGHRYHTAAKRGSQIILFDTRANPICHQTSAYRNTTAKRFCERYDVRDNMRSRFAAGEEPIAGATNASLHLVVNQNDPVLVTEFSQRLIESRTRHANTGHRLNRFEHNRCDSLVREHVHGFNVSKLGFEMPRHVWSPKLAIFTKESCADRIGGAPVETAGKGNDV